MKTNTNKTKSEARSFRREYLAMMAEVATRREAYFEMMAEIKAAEDEIVTELYTVLADIVEVTGKMPTAAQLTAAMKGKMSRHEVVGQLTVALGEHYNGYGRTKKATHKPTQDAKGRVKADYKRITQRFAEVDENGKLVPGGATIAKTDTVKVYGFRG